MAETKFDMFVSYSQFSVFAAGLERPFNDWEQEHVDQGFAWREESVAFATLEEAGTLHCEALTADSWLSHPQTVRAIRVPFRVDGESIEIASISDGVVFKLGAIGPCALVFETWTGADGDMQARITFVPSMDEISPQILIAGALNPPAQLRMTARSA